MVDIEEIIKFLLVNERERRLLETLYEGKKSFVELKRALEIKHNVELSRALENLGRFVLFENIFERKAGDKVFSFYQINTMGKNILEMVRDVEKYIAQRKAAPASLIVFKCEPAYAYPLREVVMDG